LINWRHALLAALGGAALLVHGAAAQQPAATEPAAPAASPAPAELTAAPFDVHRPEIAEWIEEVVSHDGWSRKSVLALLAQAQPQPKVLEIMGRPL
jgi:hypothetical protein